MYQFLPATFIGNIPVSGWAIMPVNQLIDFCHIQGKLSLFIKVDLLPF